MRDSSGPDKSAFLMSLPQYIIRRRLPTLLPRKSCIADSRLGIASTTMCLALRAWIHCRRTYSLILLTCINFHWLFNFIMATQKPTATERQAPMASDHPQPPPSDESSVEDSSRPSGPMASLQALQNSFRPSMWLRTLSRRAPRNAARRPPIPALFMRDSARDLEAATPTGQREPQVLRDRSEQPSQVPWRRQGLLDADGAAVDVGRSIAVAGTHNVDTSALGQSTAHMDRGGRQLEAMASKEKDRPGDSRGFDGALAGTDPTYTASPDEDGSSEGRVPRSMPALSGASWRLRSVQSPTTQLSPMQCQGIQSSSTNVANRTYSSLTPAEAATSRALLHGRTTSSPTHGLVHSSAPPVSTAIDDSDHDSLPSEEPSTPSDDGQPEESTFESWQALRRDNDRDDAAGRQDERSEKL